MALILPISLIAPVPIKAQTPEEEIARLKQQGVKKDNSSKVVGEIVEASKEAEGRAKRKLDEERARRWAEMFDFVGKEVTVRITFLNSTENVWVRMVNVDALDRPSKFSTRESPGMLREDNHKELSRGQPTYILPGLDKKIAGRYLVLLSFTETHLFSADVSVAGRTLITISPGSRRVNLVVNGKFVTFSEE